MAVTERDILMGPRGKKVITHMATKAQLTKIESPFKFWHSPCIQHWKEVNFCLGIGKKVKKWKKKKFLEKWPFLRQSGTWKSSITINIFGKLKSDMSLSSPSVALLSKNGQNLGCAPEKTCTPETENYFGAKHDQKNVKKMIVISLFWSTKTCTIFHQNYDFSSKESCC